MSTTGVLPSHTSKTLVCGDGIPVGLLTGHSKMRDTDFHLYLACPFALGTKWPTTGVLSPHTSKTLVCADGMPARTLLGTTALYNHS